MPIYLGAGNITAHVPPECFIDKRGFPSYEDLYGYLTELSAERYGGLLTAAANFIGDLRHALLFTPERVATYLLDAM